MNLSKTEKRLLDLLRAALNGTVADVGLFTDICAEEWQACRELAVRQGVMALAWDGLLTLPIDRQPPKAIRLNWAMAVEGYEKRYRRYCHTMAELSRLYAEQGISTVQLKGVGLSTYYPIPSHREGGDLDIFTWSSDTSRMSDREANRRADALMEERGIEVDYERTVKHSVFYYKGIPVENHKTFVNSETYSAAVEVDAWLRKSLRPVLAELGDGECVLIPSVAFNTVFIAFHAAQHYTRGLALHHLCDWACLLNRHGLRIPDEITDEPFRRMMLALTYLCDTYLGTSIGIRDGRDLAEEMLAEILHPPYAKVVPDVGKWGILVYKTRRMLHSYRLSNKVLSYSLARRIGRSIWVHIRHPRVIFLKG